MLLTPPLTRVGKILDPRCVDEVDCVIAVFFKTSGDSQNVWIENDVAARKPGALGQQFVSARADLDLTLERIGLAAFVKRHHDDGSPISPDQSRLPKKFFLAVFQTDRIHDRFALHAF